MKNFTFLQFGIAIVLMTFANHVSGQSSTADNIPGIGKFLGYNAGQNLDFRTNNITRMRLMETGVNTLEGYTYNHDGFLMLSMDPNGFNYKPFSLLHLNGLGNHSWGPQTFGYRDWMKAGIIFTHNRDFMYVGPMSNGLDKTDAVIAWADNKESGDIGPDVLRKQQCI